MPAASYWKALIWSRLSGSKADRSLCRNVSRHRPVRIVEFGVGDLSRAMKVISLAQRTAKEVAYCGIDLFDAREEEPGLKLKDAHHQLALTGAKVRLVPGELPMAVARTANVLTETDLLIVDAQHDDDALSAISGFLPRMVHPRTFVARYHGDPSQPKLHWPDPESFWARQRRAA